MIRRVISNRRGTAAAEFVLTLPMMLALLFGAMEAGHFFWTQHKIVKSVRDGARYASRLDVTQLCANNATLLTQIRNVTTNGQLSGGTPKCPAGRPPTSAWLFRATALLIPGFTLISAPAARS